MSQPDITYVDLGPGNTDTCSVCGEPTQYATVVVPRDATGSLTICHFCADEIANLHAGKH